MCFSYMNMLQIYNKYITQEKQSISLFMHYILLTPPVCNVIKRIFTSKIVFQNSEDHKTQDVLKCIKVYCYKFINIYTLYSSKSYQNTTITY